MRGWKYLSVRRTAAGLLLIGMAVLFAGCESDSANSPVTIDPDNIQIRRGQEQVFVASGGYDYSWSLENNQIGTLTRTRDNNRVTYTAIAAPDEGTEVQVLKLTSWIEGASRQSTVTTGTANDTDSEQSTTPRRVTSEAYIVHLADRKAPEPSDPAAELTISPTSKRLATDGDAEVFTVSGGTPGYQWSLSNTSLGTMIAEGTRAVYTRGPDPGNLFIRVRDASGTQVAAAIIQTENGSNDADNNNNDDNNNNNPPIP